MAVAAQQIQQIDTVLSSLPASIDAATLVQLLLTLLASKPRDRFFRLNVPVVDDLLDPLQTLAAWSLLDNDARRGARRHEHRRAVSARLREAAAQPLADLAVSLNATVPQWRRAALSAAADAIATNLAALDAALEAGNAAAAATALTALNTALDDYDALRLAMARRRAGRRSGAAGPAHLVADGHARCAHAPAGAGRADQRRRHA